jgi:hypothetical protein
MAQDTVYTPGGTDAVSGNYERAEGQGYRFLRAVVARRGRWLGGRGRVFGSRVFTIKKIDENTNGAAPQMIAEAGEFLTRTGEIVIHETQVIPHPGREDALDLETDFTDQTTGDSTKLRSPVLAKG